jgi:AsmA protein
MNGTGSINLAAQTIDLRLSPRGTTTLDGQGGRAITVPIRVGGTFSKPTIGIDAESLARTGLQQTLQNVISGAGKKDGEEGATETKDPARSLLEGVLGGKPKPAEDTGEPKPEDDQSSKASTEETLIKEGLNSLFGRKKAQPAEEEPAEEEEPQP